LQIDLFGGLSVDADVNLKLIVDRYELSGADIVNILHYACAPRLINWTASLTNKYWPE